MVWNHRVMRHAPRSADDAEWFGLHEVHYTDGPDSPPIGHTERPVPVVGASVEELRQTLRRMLAALDQPVLDAADDQARRNT